MSAEYLLDTHVWIWLQTEDRTALTRTGLQWLQEAHQKGRLCLSHISYWEIANLDVKGRIALLSPLDEFIAKALGDPMLRQAQLTPPILIDANRLPGELHRDPADRMLVSSARHRGSTLLTRDEKILEYARSGYVAAKKI